MRFLGQKRRKKITAKTKAIKSVASPFGLRSWPFDAAQGRAVGRFAADLDAGLKSLCEKSKFMGRAFSPCDAPAFYPWGFAPCWYGSRRWRFRFCFFLTQTLKPSSNPTAKAWWLGWRFASYPSPPHQQSWRRPRFAMGLRRMGYLEVGGSWGEQTTARATPGLLGGCDVPWVLVDVFAAGADDAEDCNVDVADGRNDEGVLDADAVGEMAFGERNESSADDGGDHEA